MQALTERFLRADVGRALDDVLRRGGRANAVGMADAAKSFLVAAFGERRRSVLFVPDEARARITREALSAFVDPEDIVTFHGREWSLYDAQAVSRDVALERAAVLTELLAGDVRFLIVPADAALQRLRAPDVFARAMIELRLGATLAPETLERRLVHAGYERVPLIECPGQYARRGDILDIWPSGTHKGDVRALRLSFFDVDIDELKTLDPESQRSIAPIEHAVIPPARDVVLLPEEWDKMADALPPWVDAERADAVRRGLEPEAVRRLVTSGERDIERFEAHTFFPSLDRWLPFLEPTPYTVIDYLGDGVDAFYLDEPLTFSRRMDAAHAGFAARVTQHMERGDAFPIAAECQMRPAEVFRAIDRKRPLIALVDMPSSGNGLPEAETVTWRARASERYRGRFDRLSDHIEAALGAGGVAVLYAGNEARAERLTQFLTENNILTAIVSPNALPRGFVADATGLFVVGSEDLYGVDRRRSRKKRRARRDVFFSNLVPGALVVHEDYGVGRYEGTESIITSDGARDYLTVVYRDGLLHLPVDRIELLSPYIPVGDARPKLAKMGGTEWRRQKARARDSIKQLVTDITALYAERRKIEGHAFGPDTPWQQAFEMDFPYEETEDQLRAIEEIKRDMESTKVMDRLVCGDVGFGKTEVAFRALFKCVMDGKQAALLAPTTVLVRQHYETLSERIGNFPVRVRQLSRFESPESQRQTVRDLAEGRVDIVIGTHRLLSKDVTFKDLGLLVIDEEQRFGVDHKEMIKALTPAVDVLTLTATPIPRTLHLSLSGIRDISLLEEGPEDRLPIQTVVAEYDEDLILEAILREQARHGQVFYLYNNTYKIDRKAIELEQKLPGVRFGVAHGRMSERRLESVIEAFLDGAYDVLVCTTIIESGIDMPRVNTLIVEDADRFGLAQLYQLRGRVGRSGRQAYALITYDPERTIGEAAQKRLAAIRDFTELGSGFQIALRDLEVRGAGNLLGAEQSGHLENIGYDLYTKMLDEAVTEAKTGRAPAPKRETVVDLVVDATLPETYVREGEERLDLYRRIASIETIEDHRDVYDELLDRYGEPPKNVRSLLDIAYIRAFGERTGFSRIRAHGDDVELILADDADMDDIGRVIAAGDRRHPLTFKAGHRPMIVVRDAAERTADTPRILSDLFAASERPTA
ncbi:MAG: transcription-repair coupling factor [Saccharofermentanales bacterium]